MKNICIVLSMLVCFTSYGQEITFNSDSASYKIMDTNLVGAKSDLHRKAQGWVINKFKDSKKAIKLDDMDTGELRGMGTIALKGKETCSFTFHISTRDRAFEAEIYEIGVFSVADTSVKKYASLSQADRKSKKSDENVESGIRKILKELHSVMKSEKNFSSPSPAPLD